MVFRRIFWNYKQSFLGLKFAQSAPLEAMKLIVPVVMPLQVMFILHKGRL